MLENIHAERSGDWKGQLASQAKMLPYFFCTNKRKNYYRWLPVCLLETACWPSRRIETKFEAGDLRSVYVPMRLLMEFGQMWL